ncbi:MAG: helix-turn-helix transcriptional regulator [Verrucomicrobia bacterium]|nr:helix-turn-helix transcriptional regulator [Verrucomicrobiota bacterium]
MPDPNNAKIFAANLRRYIDLSGKRDREIAEIVGVSTGTMSEWLNGKKYPRISKIEKLAQYFNIQKADLIEAHTSGRQPEDPRAVFKINMADLMRLKGKTQADISRDLGVPQATVSSWCVGTKFPRVEILRHLAEYLGTDISSLLSAGPAPDPSGDPRLAPLIDRASRLSQKNLDLLTRFAEILLEDPKP